MFRSRFPLTYLLLLPLTACDPEALDAESEDRLAHEQLVELELERADADEFDDEAIYWTEATDITAPASTATCGPGHWEYKSSSPGCDTCSDPEWPEGEQSGQKYNHYKRWCWDGQPACGGCGGWQYTGWSCLNGC